MRPGEFVSRRGAWVVAAWLALAAALWGFVPAVDPAKNESTTYLPPRAESRLATEAIARHFPDLAGQSEAAIVFERRGEALSHEDSNSIEFVADLMRDDAGREGGELRGVKVRSPRSIPLPSNPLMSPVSSLGQAAVVQVEIPANFVTIHSARAVKRIRAILAGVPLPAGLDAAVTGASGYGADYAQAAHKSNDRSFAVTIATVLIILVVVYRAPLAAAVPLGAVTLAAAIVIKLLDAFSFWGLHAGTAERTFVFVLLYGAGTDYSLLLVSRYREFLMDGLTHRAATAGAWTGTFRAILASGLTNSVGLLALCAARFRIFQTTGPAIAAALAIMTLAALSLVPAMIAIAGPGIFWPRRLRGAASPAGARQSREGRFWRWVSVLVTTRPLAVLVISGAALVGPAVAGARVNWVYDQLTTLAPTYGAVRGANMVMRHWSVGQLGPLTVLLVSKEPIPASEWEAVSRDLCAGVSSVPGVEDVRCLEQPVGKGRPPPAASATKASAGSWLSNLGDGAAELAARLAARREYLSDDGLAMRMSVVLADPVFSREAMSACRAVRAKVEASLAATPKDLAKLDVHLAGVTPDIADVRSITSEDFHRVAAIVVGLIFVILLALLRKAMTSLFMAACTAVSYLAALGVAKWVFAWMGADGLDWKVQIFLFVVMVAVGVDYSIFLGARMLEESRRLAPRPGAALQVGAAIRRAVARTGPVISSCGVIMAATLGSLMTGDLALLHQLGFTMAFGMLMDTFLVRPLLVPAFATIFWRR
jgi:putative drug exporter of the RND superfamily